LHIDYAIVPHLEVGLGVSGRIVWASDALPNGPTQSVATGGGLAVVRYEVPMGPLALSLGPELEFLRAVSVAVEAAPPIEVLPPWVVGFSIDAITR
jgi:hypothetical protein